MSENNLTYVMIIIFALIEFYLGKTDKVKSNSTIELVINIAMKLWTHYKGSKNGSIEERKP